MRDETAMNSPGSNILKRMVGKRNEEVVNINNVPVRALLDTGSDISTITEEALEQLNPRPVITSMDDFGLDIRSAGGHAIPYKGYIVADISVPYLMDVSELIPMLVVPLTEYNKTVPVIVGTNIIHLLKDAATGVNQIPDNWRTAYDALVDSHVGVVKTTQKVVLQPIESKIITGFARKARDVESAVTEQAEEGTSRVGVCPRIVTLDNPGKTARIPVKVFNISARPVIIPAKSTVCELKEVSVLRSADISVNTDTKDSASVNQQSVAPDTSDAIFDKISFEESCISEDQKKDAKEFLQ